MRRLCPTDSGTETESDEPQQHYSDDDDTPLDERLARKRALEVALAQVPSARPLSKRKLNENGEYI